MEKGCQPSRGIADVGQIHPKTNREHQQFGKILIMPRGSRDLDLGEYEIVPPYDHCASLQFGYKISPYSLLNIVSFVSHVELWSLSQVV